MHCNYKKWLLPLYHWFSLYIERRFSEGLKILFFFFIIEICDYDFEYWVLWHFKNRVIQFYFQNQSNRKNVEMPPLEILSVISDCWSSLLKFTIKKNQKKFLVKTPWNFSVWKLNEVLIPLRANIRNSFRQVRLRGTWNLNWIKQRELDFFFGEIKGTEISLIKNLRNSNFPDSQIHKNPFLPVSE